MVGQSQSAVNAALMAAVGTLMEQVNSINANTQPQSQNSNSNHSQGNHYTAIASQIARSRARTYDGTIDPILLSEWFRDMEKQFTLYRVDDADRVNIASHFLVKEADRWWAMIKPTAEVVPGFGWDSFKVLVEKRFYPQELRLRKISEFLAFKQGTLSVQAYTDQFNHLAHYAGHLTRTEEEKMFFYRDGFSAKIQSMIRREAATTEMVYNDALWAEGSIEAQRVEAAASRSVPFQKPFTPSHQRGQASKRFKPNPPSMRSRNFSRAAPNKLRSCYKC